MIPDGHTRLSGLLGHPVAHSMSPAIHTAALSHEGRNAVYLAFDVELQDLQGAISGLQALGAAGVNVTIPHKTDVCRFSKVAESAGLVEAANVLLFESGRAVAHNTDVEGVSQAVQELEVDFDTGPALLLGAGGAGRAAAWALAGFKTALLLANRTHEKAEQLRDQLRFAGHEAEAIGWTDVESRAPETSLILNATSLGLESSESPLATSLLDSLAVGRSPVILDLVYGPGETPLVRAARQAGLRASDGLGVLVFQAAAAYELFWGTKPSVDVMMSAARTALGRSTPATETSPLV